MTSGSSMLATIVTALPQRLQIVISILNTRLSRCAEKKLPAMNIQLFNKLAAEKQPSSLGRHLVRAEHYRNLRIITFIEWSRAVA